MNLKYYILCYVTHLFRICIFLLRIRDTEMWWLLSTWIIHNNSFACIQHVYKVGFWVETSSRMNYCAIFQYKQHYRKSCITSRTPNWSRTPTFDLNPEFPPLFLISAKPLFKAAPRLWANTINCVRHTAVAHAIWKHFNLFHRSHNFANNDHKWITERLIIVMHL